MVPDQCLGEGVMKTNLRYIVGTSGYSFGDWVGTFYPPGTRQSK